MPTLTIMYMYQIPSGTFNIKGNVAAYKDLNIEFVTKKVFVTRTQCKNTIKPYRSRAYCSCVGYDFVCDGDRACKATVEFQDRLQTLIDCAHEQDGNFHDSWRQNGNAFNPAVIQGGLSSRTHAYTIIYSC